MKSRLLLLGFATAGVVVLSQNKVNNPHSGRITINPAPDGSRVVMMIPNAGKEAGFKVFTVSPRDRHPSPVMGQVELHADRFIFVPTLPFLSGERYRAEWTSTSGTRQRTDFELPLPQRKLPTVQFLPRSSLPANTLKFYLQFSEPMEQGVFLDRLRLLDGDGKEVIGPFRETELWSPDGKRLTVWFHPGRQKTGVNLNEDEGPVLHENSKHTIIVAGSWRSTDGIALGDDASFTVQVGNTDHECPAIARWEFELPASGTLMPLVARFDEPLDTAMLASALTLLRGPDDQSVDLSVTVAADGRSWSATPSVPWQAGDYELYANPDLEDLAGNSLIKPFEVETDAPIQSAGSLKKTFVIE